MRLTRIVLVALGALLIAYAVGGALADADVRPGVLIFLAGALVAHDVVLLPLVIAAGAGVGRIVPARGRAVIRAGLIIGLAVTVVALPLVLGRGRAADNPSLLPLDYGRGLLLVHVVLWAAVAVTVAVRRPRTQPLRGVRRS